MNGTMKEPNFYSAGGLDRAGRFRRDEAWLAEKLADPSTRFIPVWRGENLVIAREGDTPRAALLARDRGAALSSEAVLLGVNGEAAYFAIDLSALEAPLAAIGDGGGMAFTDLRRVGPLLPRQEGALLAYARGIAYWHSRHRFCGVCGAPTRNEDGGHVRRCTDPACDAQHFPRTDPAVIMLVHDGERCLLGRKEGWPAGMHSTLAGFVEPGESLEEAVAREVFEETGIGVDEIAYHSSQPWPFPASLMLGFHARARSTAINIDAAELEDASWFERSFLLAHRDDAQFRLPRRDSIARRLIEDWLTR
jgi:NAD+ diphosphatase